MMTQEILTRNNVHVLGSGTQPIMFAHGFGCAQGMWRFVVPAFADTYRIILFDYVGAGKSDLQAFDDQRYRDLSGYAQDVLDICEALDLHNLIFVGHSVSGMIGMLASIQAPERFEHLIMIGPSSCYVNHPPDYVGGFERADIAGLLGMMEKNYAGWASFLAPMVMRNADRPELAGELEESFRVTDPAIARHFAEATFFCDYRSTLPNATTPTLILQSLDDMIVPREATDYLQRNMPRSALRMLAATGHYPHVSHPAEVIEHIQHYLAQPLAPTSRQQN